MTLYTTRTLKLMGIKADNAQRIKNEAKGASAGLKAAFNTLKGAIETGKELGANLQDAPKADKEAYDDAVLAMSKLKQFHQAWRAIYSEPAFE